MELKTAFCIANFNTDNLVATGKALGADMVKFKDVFTENDMLSYDCVIFTDSKDYELLGELPIKLKERNPNVFIGIHQEGEKELFYRDYANLDHEIICRLRRFEVADFIICHDTSSAKFFSVFSNNKPCVASTPFLNIGREKGHFKSRSKKRKVILIGGNYGYREGGLFGLLISRTFAQKHGFKLETRQRHRRFFKQEIIDYEIIDKRFNVNCSHQEILPHNDYVEELSKYYVLVWLMEPAASRIHAECACVGTPVIGVKCDTMDILWPELAIDKYDLEKGQKLLERLITDTVFYDKCVRYAQANIHKVGIEEGSKLVRDKVYKLYKERKK